MAENYSWKSIIDKHKLTDSLKQTAIILLA